MGPATGAPGVFCGCRHVWCSIAGRHRRRFLSAGPEVNLGTRAIHEIAPFSTVHEHYGCWMMLSLGRAGNQESPETEQSLRHSLPSCSNRIDPRQ